jgi:hypothetical protein
MSKYGYTSNKYSDLDTILSKFVGKSLIFKQTDNFEILCLILKSSKDFNYSWEMDYDFYIEYYPVYKDNFGLDHILDIENPGIVLVSKIDDEVIWKLS